MVLRNGTFEWSSQAPVHKVTDLNNRYIHIIGLGFTGHVTQSDRLCVTVVRNKTL